MTRIAFSLNSRYLFWPTQVLKSLMNWRVESSVDEGELNVTHIIYYMQHSFKAANRLFGNFMT